MKIACIGNMNNMLFQVGRYLIDDGHEVTFFLFDEFEHFLPQADTFEDISRYNIVKLGWNFETFSKVSASEIKKLFSDFGFLIGTDLAPAYLFKGGMKLDLFVPHGSDLYQFPFFRYRNNPPQAWEIPANLVSRAQFIGIKDADSVGLDVSDEAYEAPYRKIRTASQKRILIPPYLYYKQYSENYPLKSVVYSTFQEIRNKYNFIAFQQISQDWSMRGEFKIDKGNNHLINGFAEYLKAEPEYNKDSLLILMEYGGDVDKSKQLIKDLGIENNVMWLKKMHRKDLMVVIHFSDVCIGELGYRKWYSYNSVMEFMAMKKPLIHHRGDDFYREKGLELYPMVDASTSGEVARVFSEYRKNKMKYVEMGAAANTWVKADAEKRVKAIRELLATKKKTNRFPFSAIKKLAGYYFNVHIIYNSLFLQIYKLRNAIRN